MQRTHVIFSIFLFVLTVAFYTFVEDGVAVPIEIKIWRVIGDIESSLDSNRLELANSQVGESISATSNLVVPEEAMYFRVSAMASAINIVGGEEAWHGGRLYLTQIGADGEADWSIPHNLFTLTGDSSAKTYAKDFSIKPGVKDVEIVVQLHNVTGQVSISDLSIAAIYPSSIYNWVKWVLVCLWFGLFLMIGFSLFVQIETRIGKILVASVLLVCVIGMFLPQSMQIIATENLAQKSHIKEHTLTGIFHFSIFFLLTFLFRLQRKNYKQFPDFILLAFFSLVFELIQPLVGRNMEITDFAVNILGVSVAMILVSFLHLRDSFGPSAG